MAKLFVSIIVIFAFIVMSANGRGELGPLQEADDDVRQMVSRLRKDILNETCGGNRACLFSGTIIDVINYKTQVIAGTNYLISATVGDDIYHIKIHQTQSKTEKLVEVQGPKQRTDEITLF